MHYVDMSKYRYYLPAELEDVYNVGWLTKDHDFSKGTFDSHYLKILKDLIRGKFPYIQSRVNDIRGQHPCNFCGERVLFDGEPYILGSAEIWIPFKSGILAAPSLILHYIEEHSYQPPDEFAQALVELKTDQVFDGESEYESRRVNLMKNRPVGKLALSPLDKEFKGTGP